MDSRTLVKALDYVREHKSNIHGMFVVGELRAAFPGSALVTCDGPDRNSSLHQGETRPTGLVSVRVGHHLDAPVTRQDPHNPDDSMRLRLFVLVLLPMQLQAQLSRDSVIAVSATRTERIAPDRASFYVVVEGTAETAADAVARVETKLKGVSEALKGFGSRVEADRPISYAVGPTPAPNGYPGAATPASNVSRSVIRVQLSRPDQIANVIAAVLGAGAVGGSSISFESSVADSVRRVRVADALAAARLDAESIAQSLGGRLGALIDVSTSGAFGFQQPPMLNFDNRFPQQSPTPEVTINATVTVRYKLLH